MTLAGQYRSSGNPVVLPAVAYRQPLEAPGPRSFIGIQVRSRCREVAGVLVRTEQAGLNAHFELLHSTSMQTPSIDAKRYEALAAGRASASESSLLARNLAAIQAEIVRRLIATRPEVADGLFAVGVHDPGLWHVSRDEPTCYASLCDPARLAELTGLCVVDAFPARDLAAGGLGGPVTALAQWLLLHDPDRSRILLDLGRTSRLAYLPAARTGNGLDGVLAFDIGPGTSLLDELARQFTEGKVDYDPGGHLAVQGKKIPDLIDHWLGDPYFKKSLPRWYALGVQPNDELQETVRMAVDCGWTIRDLLCTATHFIAECVKQAIVDRLPADPPTEEILIAGGGAQNGMLIKEIRARLPGNVLTRCTQLGLTDAVLDAACVAVLVMLHVDQVPANHTAITGSDGPRVLGRLTPGSPPAWRRLVQVVGAATKDVTSLRSAI